MRLCAVRPPGCTLRLEPLEERHLLTAAALSMDDAQATPPPLQLTITPAIAPDMSWVDLGDSYYAGEDQPMLLYRATE